MVNFTLFESRSGYERKIRDMNSANNPTLLLPDVMSKVACFGAERLWLRCTSSSFAWNSPN
jgi:hypothetical protein